MSQQTVDLTIYRVRDNDVEGGFQARASYTGPFGSLDEAREHVPEWAKRSGETSQAGYRGNDVVVTYEGWVDIIQNTVQFPLDTVQTAIGESSGANLSRRSENMTTYAQIAQRRAELAAEEQRLREEEERLAQLTPEQRVAEALHERLCHSNHDDQCGWFYEKWERLNGFSTRKQYLEKAIRVLTAVNQDEALALNVINAL